MSRYNGSNGGSNGGSNNGDYDDVRLNIKRYSTVRFTPKKANGNLHQQFGASFITNYTDAEVLDGVVLQRDDAPNKWSVYSADHWFNLNPEDGLVYENYDEETGEYSDEMSAQDILEHPRVVGHSTTGGSSTYYFQPVGVVIEEAGDIAVHEDADVETTEEPTIEVGDASTLLSNSAWVRTFAKKMSAEGDAIVDDNGMDPTPRGEEDDNPKYNSHEWMTTHDPDLRSELEGRTLELWVTEETNTFEDGETQTYTTPNLMDVKTGEFVNIDNEIGESQGDDSQQEAAATDGGTVAESGSTDTDTESTESTETTDSPDNSGGSALPENVPDKLEDLIDYAARNFDDPTGDDIQDFAADEVENPDDIDWEAAANEANQRAE